MSMTLETGTLESGQRETGPQSSTGVRPERVGLVGPRTYLPRQIGSVATEADRRDIGRLSRQDLLTSLGAALSALCTTLLLFGRLTPLSGKLGFLVAWFAIFLGTYTLILSLTERGPAIADRLMASLFTAAAVVAGGALVSVVGFTLWRGRVALSKPNLYTQDMSRAGPLDPLEVGGILHAIIGTLIIVGLALIVTVPLGLTCAVYLNETDGRMRGLVRTIVTAMTALPSILAGLFIFATWVLILGFQRSGFAASLAISIMMLPIIIRSAEVVLRLVPGNLREASEATGASQWRTIWHVVLPTARSGLVNAVILGVARGVGETAPVLLVSGITSTINADPRENPMMSLPLAVFEFVRSPQAALVQRGFATAAVLMLLVLLLFTIARLVAGRPAGHLSKRSAGRVARRSARDVHRIEHRCERLAR